MSNKKRYGFRNSPDLPDWYKSIMYQLGFIKINGTERNYYLNLTDGKKICKTIIGTRRRNFNSYKDY